MTTLGLSSLLRNSAGAAAAEMALVAPLLLIIMIGSFELGNYFYNNHIVIKGVRDGARYASRRGFAEYDCSAETISNANGVVAATKNVTRTGQTADGGTPRLWTWDNSGMVTVTLDCTDNAAATYSGIYEGKANVPVVRVSAVVPYGSLFSAIGFNSTALTIKAESEVPVMGI